jgi:L-seryl-tRNA(Ser) seleniumtransferase
VTLELSERLRALPAVETLAASLLVGPGGPSRAEAVAVARVVLGRRREELLAGAADDADLVSRAHQALRPTLRRVLNGTGVVIHTNLGRAPLATSAVRAVHEAASGYVNLEFDLASGRRSGRDRHTRDLLCQLTGAQDALIVNNGAAAVLLAAAALAGPDGKIAVSRGQLVEIGGGFRIPDVVAQAGARLVEVGTTNRTRLADYARAIDGNASAVLRVHQSNFRTVGFVEEVTIEALCGLGVPVIDDVGSGALAEGLDAFAGEPPVRRSVEAGAAVVCFSGDKLLGGPQAGILVGRADAIEACRGHPLARALRAGRLPTAALAATLTLYRDPDRAVREIPVLAMLTAPEDALVRRAARLARACPAADVEVVRANARAGGGSLPLLDLPGPVLALRTPRVAPLALAAALRANDPPLIARVHNNRVLVDPRTLSDDELELAAAAIRATLAALNGAGV